MPDRQPATRMIAALKRTAGVLRDADVPFALAGSMATWALGGPPSSHDVDLILRESDVGRALDALAGAGLRVERPPEGWLVKAWDGDVLIDLIWAPRGLVVTTEVLAATRECNVAGMQLPVLAPTEVMISKLLALSESHLDFEGLLAIVRGVREQIDWDELRRRTAPNPLARSFLYMVRELGLTYDQVSAPAQEASVISLEDATVSTDDDSGALVERARRALADDPHLGQLDIDIALRGTHAMVTGHVVTRERRELIGSRLAEMLPGYEIHNETTTLDALPEPSSAADNLGG